MDGRAWAASGDDAPAEALRPCEPTGSATRGFWLQWSLALPRDGLLLGTWASCPPSDDGSECSDEDGCCTAEVGTATTCGLEGDWSSAGLLDRTEASDDEGFCCGSLDGDAACGCAPEQGFGTPDGGADGFLGGARAVLRNGVGLECGIRLQLEEAARKRHYPRDALLLARRQWASDDRGLVLLSQLPRVLPTASLPSRCSGAGRTRLSRSRGTCTRGGSSPSAGPWGGAGAWRCGGGAGPPTGLRPSDSGYRVAPAASRAEEIRRSVNSLLNKICPENLGRIVQQMAAVSLASPVELEMVIRSIFQAALANSHYSETYADMVFALKSKYPEFPPEDDGSRPITFTRVLLEICQREFESVPQALEPSPEALSDGVSRSELADRHKERLLANMRFLGHLFLRNLLSARIVEAVFEDLLSGNQADGSLMPEEHTVECALELLTNIGCTLDRTQTGTRLVEWAVEQLAALQAATLVGGKPVFSKRIRFRIDDLLDLRRGKWQQKVYRERAKPLDDVRRDAAKEWACGSASACAFTVSEAGAKPSYILAAEAEAQKLAHEMSPEPAPEPAAEPSPILRPCSPRLGMRAAAGSEARHLPPGPSAGGSRGSGAGARVVAFDRSAVARLAAQFAATAPRWDGGPALCRAWRLGAPADPKEAARCALWLLEAHLCSPWAAGDLGAARETVVRASVELLRQGALSWRQLAWALERLVEQAAAEEGLPGGTDREALFCGVFIHTLRSGLFEPAAFHGLPCDRAVAWRLLLRVLQAAAAADEEQLLRHALAETWEVLCALRGVPAELSELGLFRQLARRGLAPAGPAGAAWAAEALHIP